ncbi:hypothetical protein GH714_029218 [Hevea brasiliensis]|uniref:Uncharacterized protein n=1 Tax=Hevea brasiliensis TaxID=3981 RepID=A0A6A6KXY0_HEVBR|nr:hypothetical protein GH714_029218 [Hevea brasiliensis]
MSSARCVQSEFCRERSYENTGLDLNFCYSMPQFSALENDLPACCNSKTNTNSLNSVPRLHFRDYIWAYTERYLAIEAMEEAAAAMMVGERNEVKEEEGSDGMKLVQQLIACAEAVACRDKTHASALLSELRAKALPRKPPWPTTSPPSNNRCRKLGERLRAIGDELDSYARSLGLNFEFLWVESCLENLKPKHFKLHDGEVVIINSILHLHCVVKESRGALNSVLQILHELSPKLLILVEQDSSHNGPFFLGRFMEALHYYSAIFDSLDAMLPKYDTRRAKIEQFFFAEEIKNIISCEGPARVERHERVDQWRRRLSRAGFQPAPIKMIMQAKQWLGKAKVCDGYTVTEEKGCLVLGWKSKPIIAVSCWKCS